MKLQSLFEDLESRVRFDLSPPTDVVAYHPHYGRSFHVKAVTEMETKSGQTAVVLVLSPEPCDVEIQLPDPR